MSMIIVLANGTPPPEAGYLLQFLLTLSLVGNVALVGVNLFRGSRTQKREVSFSDQFAAKESFDQQMELNRIEHEKLHKRISDGDKALASELKSDVNCLRDDLTEVKSAQAAAKQANDMQNQSLIRIEGKVDEIRRKSGH